MNFSPKVKNVWGAIMASLFTLLIPLISYGDGEGGGLGTIIKNPLAFDDIGSFIQAAADQVRNIAIIIAVIFLIWAGFKFVTAQGNESELKKAKEMLWYTIIGIAVILGAWVFVSAIKTTVDNLRASDTYQVASIKSQVYIVKVI